VRAEAKAAGRNRVVVAGDAPERAAIRA